MALQRAKPADDAWQWDGTVAGALLLRRLSGAKLTLLVDHATQQPRYLEMPPGSRCWLVEPFEWLARTAKGEFHVIESDVVNAIRGVL